jgi:hypothetical protein
MKCGAKPLFIKVVQNCCAKLLCKTAVQTHFLSGAITIALQNALHQ